MKSFEIAGRRIGEGEPCFIIAEAGVNHNGDPALAHQLIDVAADAGADAVKFQTFKAESLVTETAPMAAYQEANTGVSESQYAMLKRLELPEAAYADLLEHCKRRNILFMSAPFDEASVDFLDPLMPAFKIPSGEITNWPFLEYIARKGKPMIVSTGMCDLGEVEDALGVIRAAGADQIALLHCVSNYPAAAEELNLRAMATMRTAFNVPVGFSDHTLGLEACLAAVALGAPIIEKHFTLDKNLPGPDHKASLDPVELSALVRGVRAVEAALGDGIKRPTPGEKSSRELGRKSVVAVQNIPAGTVITREMLAMKRPGTGLAARDLPEIIGAKSNRNIAAGSLIQRHQINLSEEKHD